MCVKQDNGKRQQKLDSEFSPSCTKDVSALAPFSLDTLSKVLTNAQILMLFSDKSFC